MELILERGRSERNYWRDLWRLLTDYLCGDVYFRTHRPGHTLDRCRTQFKLVESIERQEPAMQKFVDKI